MSIHISKSSIINFCVNTWSKVALYCDLIVTVYHIKCVYLDKSLLDGKPKSIFFSNKILRSGLSIRSLSLASEAKVSFSNLTRLSPVIVLPN